MKSCYERDLFCGIKNAVYCAFIVYVCPAIGCLSSQSMDAVHSPYLTTVYDHSADACQLNADVQTAASAVDLLGTSPAVNVPRSLPVTEATQGLVCTAERSHVGAQSSVIEGQSVDEVCQLTQYPLSDLSSVLAEQTLIGSQSPWSDVAQLTQYPLSDSSSNASVRAGEPPSLLQIPLNDSPSNVGSVLHREADTAAMDQGDIETHVQLQGSDIQHHCEPSVHQLSLSVSDDQHGGGGVISDQHGGDSLISELHGCGSVTLSDQHGGGSVMSLDQHDGGSVTLLDQHGGDSLISDLHGGGSVISDQHGGGSVTSSKADTAVTSCSYQQADDQHKHDDADLIVSVSTIVSRPLSPAENNAVHSSSTTVESDVMCLASGTEPSVISHVKSDYVGTPTDKTDLNPAVLTTGGPQLDRDESATVADCKAVPAGANTLSSVTDLQSMSSSATAVSARCIVLPSDNKLPDSGWASSSSSAYVDQGCGVHVDVFNDARKMSDEAPVVSDRDQRAVTADGAVRELVAMLTDDSGQTCNQLKLLPVERSSRDDAVSFRNAADGSEASDVFSAVQTSANVSDIAAAQSSRPVGQNALCGIVTGLDNSANVHSVITEQNGTITRGHSVSNDQQPHNSVICNTDGDKVELTAGGESQPQQLMTLRDPSDVMDTDHHALPLEPDSGSEFDEEQLGDDVKMILAKYRIRRGPIGSDSVPVAGSAKTDNVLMLDADDSLLQNGRQTDGITARDVDTSSHLSDDTLAVRVKALLIKEQQQSSGRILPTATASVISQGASHVLSVCTSQGTSVDYSNLSRELNDIQMNLDSMRNSEKSSSCGQRSSTSSPCVCSPVTDASLTQEPRDVLVQQKLYLDEMLQHGSVGLAGERLCVDYDGFAATSDLRLVEADTWRSRSRHQHEMSLASPPHVGGDTKPVTTLKAELDTGQKSMTLANKDLLQTRAAAKTVQRPAQVQMTLSNTTAGSLASTAGTKAADSYTSLPGQSLRKSRESARSRNELLHTADEDTMSTSGSRHLEHVCADGQYVSDSKRDVQDSSAVQYTLHDTISEVSSLQTDIRQSESASSTCLDDFRSAHDQGTSVEAVVKKLELSVSNLIQTQRRDSSSASSADSYMPETELLKWSLIEATSANKQLPASYDDGYHLTETRLSQSFSESCGLSPVRNRSPLHTMSSIHSLLAMQLDNAAAAQSDWNVELQSPTAYSGRLSCQSFDGHLRQTEGSSQRGTGHEKQNDDRIPNQSVFVSTAHLQFTPLAEMPRGLDSSDSGSYDDDTEQPLTDRLSYDDDSDMRTYSADGGQPLSADRTLGGYGLDVNVSSLDVARNTQTVSWSPANVNLLQPYQ